jgi:hypothetical protein
VSEAEEVERLRLAVWRRPAMALRAEVEEARLVRMQLEALSEASRNAKEAGRTAAAGQSSGDRLRIISRVYPPLLHEEVHMQHPEHTARTEQLRGHLRDQGYGSGVCRSHVRIASRFLEYLYGHTRTVETATPADVVGFLRREQHPYRNRHGHAPPSIGKWRRGHTAPLRLILKLVHGKWPPEPPSKKETPREVFHRKLLNGYDIWMDQLRGLARVTRVQRIERALEFLCGLGKRSDPKRLHELQVRDIDTYLSCRAQGLRGKSIGHLISEIRVFLRYLHENGETTHDLSVSVTSPILYAYEDIASALLAEEVEKVLATTRRDHSWWTTGLRNTDATCYVRFAIRRDHCAAC